MKLFEYILSTYKPRARKVKRSEFIMECSVASFEELPKLREKRLYEPKKTSKISVKKTEKTFMEQVFAIIDEKGLNDVETYKRANVDRRLFSKMRSDMEYRPSRDTAFKFCFALELDLERARKLLSSAGYAISHASLRDVVFEYCLAEKIYDLMKVNDALYEADVTPELE